jgi:DNA (cytosine-5)-methyltransferase 1
MAGKREKGWGKEKKFREGQAEQVLDTLFFDFIDLAKELQPKVVIAENVKGLLMGNAKEYVKKIYEDFDKAGYYLQHHLLDASKMGVPQKRQRVFFIAIRKDLASKIKNIDEFTRVPKLKLEFDEPPIPFGQIYQKGISSTKHQQDSRLHNWWKERITTDKSMGSIVKRLENRNSMFSVMLINNKDVASTFTRQDRAILYEEFRSINKEEACMVQSFPLDYDFGSNKCSKIQYVLGMSVPPLMMANLANRLYNEWQIIFNHQIKK